MHQNVSFLHFLWCKNINNLKFFINMHKEKENIEKLLFFIPTFIILNIRWRYLGLTNVIQSDTISEKCYISKYIEMNEWSYVNINEKTESASQDQYFYFLFQFISWNHKCQLIQYLVFYIMHKPKKGWITNYGMIYLSIFTIIVIFSTHMY